MSGPFRRIGPASLRKHWAEGLFRNSYFIIGNSMVNTATGLVFWSIAARTYTPHEVGLAVALVSAATLAALFARLGLDGSVLRFLATEPRAGALVNTCLTLMSAAAVVLGLAGVATVDLWFPEPGRLRMEPVVLVSFVLFVIPMAVGPFLLNVAIADRQAGYAFLQNTIRAVLRLPIVWVLAPFFAVGIYWAWGLGAAIGTLVGLLLLGRHLPTYSFRPTVDPTIVARIFSFSASNYVATLLRAGIPFVLPLVVAQVVDPSASAFFYIAWTLSSPAFVVAESNATALLAASASAPDSYGSNLRKSLRHAMVLLLPFTVVLLAVGPFALRLFGESYAANGYEVLALLAVGGLFHVGVVFYNTHMRLLLRNLEFVVFWAVVATGTIGGGALLAARYGLLGVGIAYLIVQLIAGTYAAVRMRRDIRSGRTARADVA